MSEFCAKLLDFYFVFDNYQLASKYDNVFEAIEVEILRNFREISARFEFENFALESRILLTKLAKGDRKRFNLTKNIPRMRANAIITQLCEQRIIKIEKSKESKLKPQKHQKLKKSLRHYQIQDKLHFTDNFKRFWFYFCEPNLDDLICGNFDKILEIIRGDFWHYCSLPFELLSIKLLAHHLNIPKNEISSYWTKHDEIDIFIDFEGFKIVAEVKYKERKICKNVLNLLKIKCQNCAINPNLIALFSKSGFSNELLELRDEKILLFGLEDFAPLLEKCNFSPYFEKNLLELRKIF